MPLYEYECEKCGEKFEFFSRLYELSREIHCPVCGEEKPKRLQRKTEYYDSTLRDPRISRESA